MTNSQRTIWLSHLGVTAAFGFPAAVGALWWLQSTAASVWVGASCLLAGSINAWRIARQAEQASARLRRPQLRDLSSCSTGIYRSLLEEALSLLNRLEHEAREASRYKAELDARSHVRRKQTRQLESALGHLDQPLVITDAHDQVEFANAAARRLLGVNSSEAGEFGRDSIASGRLEDPSDRGSELPVDLSRVPPLKQLIAETRIRRAANDHRKLEFEWDVEARAVAYRATATNVFDNDGSLLGVVTMLQDIGEERSEKTRHAAFVSSVCHELKTPLSGMKAFVEMLMDGDVTDPEDRQELYRFIDGQLDRLTRLINNMLNLARIQSGVIQVQREDCELNGVLSKAVSVVQAAADEKRIHLVPEFSGLYLAVHIDTDLFAQAVINLLSNAVKYTPEGGEVRLKSRMDDDRAVIEVRDTGLGIPEDSLPHIFDRFYRVPENNEAAAGTGLGLALVHYIITELHNGHITVKSEVNEGTCFTVTVPLGHLDRARKKLDGRRTSDNGRESRTNRSTRGADPSALVPQS